MLFVDIIRTKRDGAALSPDQIDQFVAGLSDGSLPAEQVSALAMAIFLNGMTVQEAGALTTAMARSGNKLDWQGAQLDGPVVDKHSTGGVGDKVSFILAPLAAACGLYVPMISGRGLGHTGGTLDKISAVPGYITVPDLVQFRQTVKDVGCAIIGQTADLAPADRRFYAIRDVTGTTESIPLITASILSKKIAAGNHALVMDVKVGSGAFMTDMERASALANSLTDIAQAAGLPTHALITDMNQVLGHHAGNAVEIAETVAFLRGERQHPRLLEIVLCLTGEMIVAGGMAADRETARAQAQRALDSGRAADIFGRMLRALGGPGDFMDRMDAYLPSAPVQRPVPAPRSGFLRRIDTRAVGNAIIELGGGRRRVDDTVDAAVGFTETRDLGVRIDADAALAIVHARSERAAETAVDAYRRACEIDDEPPVVPPVVHDSLAPSPVAKRPSASTSQPQDITP